MGGQLDFGPGGGRHGSTHHLEFFSLAAGFCHPLTLGLATAAAEQCFVAALATLCAAQPVRGGLLQQLSVLSPAHLHAHQCHLGGVQRAGVHAGHGRVMV